MDIQLIHGRIYLRIFYLVHKDRPFYDELTDFMSSGQCMVLALEKDNAVSEWRTLIGSTNTDEAAEGTIRKKFATSRNIRLTFYKDV